ncbi:MAG: prepilin-type N-terminal cleavage/methylation domain-containing protein [Prevotellaceae bacterium]|jgi:prepilin-type N-terminal cleavage/methylation domain-containing protein|nr:prepilin-type N-terminal cleavage/methylation domain-containing protein [Prevotellaceae bacterium]
MNNTGRNIKAFTLAELLVVMIIAGIIMLSIMEGFALIHRITFDKQTQITENMDIYDAYYHLENVISNSDSVATDDNGNLTFYNDSNYHSAIYKDNSCLIMNFAGISDTVLKNISELRLIPKGLPYIPDTVAIDIAYQDTSTVCWKFTIPVSVEKIFELTMEEKEKDYIYE